jgi:hypothetical protein
LLRRREYDKDLIADRVALLAVYMPIIADAISSFAVTWNTHRIRRQSRRAYHVDGIPYVLYFNPSLSTPPAVDCSTHVPAGAVAQFQEGLAGYDMDEYLPPQILALCYQLLTERGFATPVDPAAVDADHNRIHVQAYLQLREQLNIQLGRGVTIVETERPLAEQQWQESNAYTSTLASANEPPFE